MPKTGNTGTISLGTSVLQFAFTKIGEYQQTRNKLEVSHLGTTGFKEFIKDDLADPGEIEVEGWFDATKDLENINAAAETITVTYPKEDPDNTAATLVGTGFLIMVGLPELVNGSVSKQKIKVAFDGDVTEPTFTPEEAGSSS